VTKTDDLICEALATLRRRQLRHTGRHHGRLYQDQDAPPGRAISEAATKTIRLPVTTMYEATKGHAAGLKQIRGRPTPGPSLFWTLAEIVMRIDGNCVLSIGESTDQQHAITG